MGVHTFSVYMLNKMLTTHRCIMCKSPQTEVSWGLQIIRAALTFGVTDKSVLPVLARFVTPGGYVSYVLVF